ncbi:OsmC family protein [Myroides guanonis]|uniref:Organic hydroperoxide reductase OsmC/OhrA n=1 Tax=Myroides guanonis TaxID=1150112 RepID=A0A1I3L7X0_9FLAO|nr:OsmC family protein [Myroides guanonis]SFI80844.1 Organic hydroperoxide reductase OsmC/OhrA [Myroides guanonis]
MILKHLFKVALRWSSEREIEGISNKRFVKNHSISIDGKPDINISAAKAFKGDASLYNPEDLILSSLASCHMMSYLYCCSQNGISIANYKDDAEAFLEVNDDGSGRIVKVILNPIVTVSDSNMIELALSLHKKANELCFIANSCNFPVVHFPSCLVI